MAMYTQADLDRRDTEEMLSGRNQGGIIIGREPALTQRQARKIMGKNFFGIEAAVRYFGATPTESERSSVIEWTEQELHQCKNTHILVATFLLSILDIRERVDQRLFCAHENAWYNMWAFAKNIGDVSWQLVRKTLVPQSTMKTWDEQQALLPQGEEAPSARVLVYTTIGHYLATSERLFKNEYVRCSDVALGGNRVSVRFDYGGIAVVDDLDIDRNPRVGLAAARKKPGNMALS